MATLVLEHSDLTGADRLGATLRDYGHRLDVRRLHEGDPVPSDLDGIDAIISCGGPQSPLDDSIEWLVQEMDLLQLANAAALPIIGLCLGCELLARALGGEVALNENGPEIGWHEVSLTPVGREDPLFAGLAWKSAQLHWHSYAISKPPEGARILAKSDRTKIQAWGLGLRTYGIQYHPECYAQTAELWAQDEPQALQAAGSSIERLRAEIERHYPMFERQSQKMFETIALIVMPLDKRFAGIAKDLHH